MKYISLLGLLSFVFVTASKPRIDTVVCVFTAFPQIPSIIYISASSTVA